MDFPSPTPSPTNQSSLWPLCAALGFGALVILLLPAGVAVNNDDFGYLRSVVESLQRERPWTDDWLEPWAASFSLLAALLYRASGSFQFATHGLLAMLAAVSFWAGCSLFRARGISARRSVALTGILLTFPTLLWKSVEFTSVALYLPCMLLALHAAEQKKWGRFCVCWGVAIAARQSALMWAALPAVEIFLCRRNSADGSRHVWAPSAALLAGLAWWGVLALTMNPTHAQSVVTDHLLDRVAGPALLRAGILGLLVYLWAAGLNGLIATARAFFAQGKLWRALPAAGALSLPAAVCCGWISVEHELFSGPVAAAYGGIAALLGAMGWLLGGFRLRPAPVFAAVGSIALLGLRPEIWDYYLLDAALLGLFGTAASAETAGAASPLSFRRVATWSLSGLAALHALFVLDLKCTTDRAFALCKLTEEAMRKERLNPDELSFAPFGFAGWQLYRHYRTHDGANGARLDGFNGYAIPGAVEVGQAYSRPLHLFPRFRHEPPGDRHNLILAGRSRFLWFFHAEFFLLRFKNGTEAPPALFLDARDFRPERFPLNDAEWRTLIDRGSLQVN